MTRSAAEVGEASESESDDAFTHRGGSERGGWGSGAMASAATRLPGIARARWLPSARVRVSAVVVRRAHACAVRCWTVEAEAEAQRTAMQSSRAARRFLRTAVGGGKHSLTHTHTCEKEC